MNLTSRDRAAAWGAIATINVLNILRPRASSSYEMWNDIIIMLAATIAISLFIWHFIAALKEGK